MKKNKTILYLFIVLFLGSSFNFLMPAKKKDSWNVWLREVDPIMADMERTVAKALKTDEERTRFMELFWKARDPDLNTPENEFQADFYRRLAFVDKFLNGVQSDRGKIYMLLGPPANKSNFVGAESVVECELWNYEAMDKPELPPFMNIVFFKPNNVGDYQLYQPGIHRPRDLLSPQYKNTISSMAQAYDKLKLNSTVLASASLSIIPSEGNLATGLSTSSSNFVLNRIYSLPDNEAAIGYVKNFMSPTGVVEVTQSTNAIRGFGCVSVTFNKGIPFIHYALMPEVLVLKKISADLYSADINLSISVEDLRGNIIYQNLRQVDMKVDSKKKKSIDEQRVVFRDFAPIIDGDFNIITTFINKTTQEFFSFEEKVTVPKFDSNPGKDGVLFPLIGFQLKEIDTPAFVPFAADKYVTLTDPRFTFSQKDVIEGVILADSVPGIYLEPVNDKSRTIPIDLLTTTEKQGNVSIYKFRKLLSEVKDGNYSVIVKNPEGKTVSRKIYILPFYIEVRRPFGMERPEPEKSLYNYIFTQGQERLSMGQVDAAIECFNRLPPSLWNASSLPLIAKAYYKKGDYAKVIDLLEKEEVKKEYAILLMLTNSSIELKSFPRALKYLELLRNYGDTVEINQLLASTYLSMGNREKAELFYERARLLKNKNQDKIKEEKK